MPTISEFYGIVMFPKDHPPPHFHALYGEHRARVAIATGEPIDGRLPPRAARLVREWAELHRCELATNWERAEQMRPLDEYNETIVWPNGADLDPDVLYGNEKPSAEPAPRITAPQRA